MLHILLTFDYELFFGKNYKTCDEVLFKPSAKIAQILSNHHVSGTFFADTCSVFAQERNKDLDYVKKFKEQLMSLNKMGHDIQLHIHPHWQRTTIENGEWKFPADWYRIHDFNLLGGEAIDIIRDGIAFLNETLHPVDEDYKCIAYRAGGYCIQPYDELIKVLYSEGIRIDSSICMYKDNTVPSRYYDYKNMPNALNWWIQPCVDLQNCSTDKPTGIALYEVPVGYYHQSLFDRILLRNKVYYKHGEPLGKAMPTLGSDNVNEQGFIAKLLTYNKQYQRLSLDSMSAELAYLAVKILYKMYNANNNDVYVAFVSHPKVFTGEAFDNLDRFINLILQSKCNMDFVTTIDIYHSQKFV